MAERCGPLVPRSSQNHLGRHPPLARCPPMPYQSRDRVDRGGDRMELSPSGHPAQTRGPQFSNQLPPPPSTLVNPPQNYYPPYADSTRSSTPSERGRDRELPRGPDPAWAHRGERHRGTPPVPTRLGAPPD